MRTSRNALVRRVRLHRALYTEDAIRDAARTFAEFASFAMQPKGEHWILHIHDIKPDVEGDVVAEFCNFALANTAIRRKSGHA